MHRLSRRALVALVVCVLVAGCASEREEPKADSAEASSTTMVAADTGFGTLPSPCGKGDGGGATDVGVTADAIHIGYGDDAGFAGLPGGGHEMSDAVKAMIEWCNDQGGINGRPIVGTYYDAKITEVNNAVTQACNDKVFMLIGEGWTLDSTQEAGRLGCGLPAFPTYGVSPQFTNAPKMVAAVPNPVDFQPVGLARWYAETYPAKAKKVGTVALNFAASLDTLDKQRSTWPKVGVTFLGCDLQLSITGEADYKPFAQKLKDCGAEAVSFIATPYPVFENFLEAAAQLDYHPDYLLEANFYDQQFSKWNTDGFGDGVFVRLTDVPLEQADRNEATGDYVRIVQANGGDVSDLGIHATSAFLLWATSVQACGADVTRDCVVDHALSIHDWDGGGLGGKADVGKNLPSNCELVVTLDGTAWKQVAPAKAGDFICDPDNVQAVTGPVVDKVNLGPDRIVHQFEPPGS
jgi:ABC-type branched-subunit amino acid transport system substrate-binding protein